MSAYVGSSKNLKDLKDAILCTGGPDVIRKEAWPLVRTISGVRPCWGLEEPKGPKTKCPVRSTLGHGSRV